jgi:itaconate CoA-transferase
MTSTLDGITIIDLSQGVSGPLCSRFLSQLGARVIKVEQPGVGDLVRNFDSICNGESSGHVWVNTGKESVCVDLASPEGSGIIRRLLGADNPVLLHNFVPGHMEKFGLDYESLSDEFPDLIYAGISAYGKTGPYAERGAIDLIIQGESGLLMLNGTPDQPARIALSVSDIAAANYMAMGILEAVIHRLKSGKGQEISVSLLESVLGWSGYYPYMVWYDDHLPQRQGLYHPTIVPYGPYEAADGRYVFIAGAGGQWKRFCTAVERNDLFSHERFATPSLRKANRDELHDLVCEIIKTRTADDWLNRFVEGRVPCGLMRDLRDALNHPQLAEVSAIKEVPSRNGPLKVLDLPIHSSVSEHRIGAGPPGLGEHSDSVLAEFGCTEAEIESLRSTGVIA